MNVNNVGECPLKLLILDELQNMFHIPKLHNQPGPGFRVLSFAHCASTLAHAHFVVHTAIPLHYLDTAIVQSLAVCSGDRFLIVCRRRRLKERHSSGQWPHMETKYLLYFFGFWSWAPTLTLNPSSTWS